MLYAVPPVKWITSDVSVPIKPELFPEEKLQACETFNAEWLQHRFTKQELADVIEGILAEIEPSPMLEHVGPNTTLVLKASGTFLHDPDDESGTLKEI